MAESVALVHVGNGEARQGRVELFGAGGDAVGSGVAVRMDDRLYSTPACDVLPGTLLLQNLPSARGARAGAATGRARSGPAARPAARRVHIVALMEGRGEVVAVDRAKERLPLGRGARSSAETAPIIEFRALDGTFAHESFAPRSLTASSSTRRARRWGCGRSCSSRRPPPSSARAPATSELVASAAALVRPGGLSSTRRARSAPARTRNRRAHPARARTSASRRRCRSSDRPASTAAGSRRASGSSSSGSTRARTRGTLASSSRG